VIFVDTVAWLYLFDKGQGGENQKRALAFIGTNTEPLATSDLVIAETHKWLVHHGRPAVRAQAILEKLALQEIAQILALEQSDREEAAVWVKKYADQKLSYTDACAVAVMKRLGLRKIFSFDRHFRLFPELETIPS
jgi:predicted nucleic acid-binding protein